MVIIVPFGRCPCLAKLGWCWLCSLLTVFAGLAAGTRKRPPGPAPYWRGEAKADVREENHCELQRQSNRKGAVDDREHPLSLLKTDSKESMIHLLQQREQAFILIPFC